MKFDIRRLETTASTNDDAKQAAEADVAEGLVVWALQQSAGRGRQGRQWSSPAGNLYASVLLRPVLPRRNWGFFSFVAALAISDAVQAFLPEAVVELKWPNDALVNGKKISGILLEAGEDWIVIGIGVNVRHYPETPLYPVTSMAAERENPPALDALLDKILTALGHWYAELSAQGFVPLRAAWLHRARQGALRVRSPQGDIHGTFVDIDEAGNLRLRLADGGVQSVNTGDVFFGVV